MKKNALTLVFASGSHKTGIGWKTLNGKFRLENRKHSRARKHTLRFPGGAKDYRAKGKDNAIVTPCRSVRGSTLGERKKRGGKKREKKKKEKKSWRLLWRWRGAIKKITYWRASWSRANRPTVQTRVCSRADITLV